MRDRCTAALRLACSALALVTIAPVAADAQGIMGRVKRQAAETLGVPGAGGGSSSSRSPFPPGFSNPEYEITEDRLQLILAVAPRIAAEARATEEKNERDQAEAERRRDQARRENARISEKNRPYTECIARAGVDMQQVMASGPSDKSAKLMELQQRLATVAGQAAMNMRTRADSIAYMRANYEIMDQMLAVIGRNCGPAPTEFVTDQPGTMAYSAEEDSSSPDYEAQFLRETRLEQRQWGVIRDKLIAFYSATRNNRELAGFNDSEKAALSRNRAALQQHEQVLSGGSRW